MTNESEWVTLATFNEHAPALLAKSVLDAANILCWLRDEHVGRMIGLYSVAFGGIQLQVRPADFAVAANLLQHADVSNPPSESTE